MRAKKVSDSAIDYHPVQIFPGDLNAKHTIFGGRVLSEMDRVAGIVAQRHSNQLCVTKFIDSVDFLAPAKQGEVLVYKAAVNRVWGKSMEIGVKVIAENFQTQEKRHIFSAYLTFVTVDDNGKSTPVSASIEPETDDEKIRYLKAEARRQQRFYNQRP